MKRFSRCVRIGALLIPCWLPGVAASAALAQTGVAPALPAQAALEKRVAALLGEVNAQSKRDAAGAIARIDAFVGEQPELASAEVAQLWGFKAQVQHEKLGDLAAALQTYRAARARFADETRPKSAWIGAGLLAGEARVLLAQNQAPAAVALLEAQWPIIARSNSNRRVAAWSRTLDAVNTYVAALEAVGRSAEVPDALAARLLQAPAALDFADHERDLGTLLLDLMREQLDKAGRGDEVASWVRLRYATCDYSVAALDGATVFLARSWRKDQTTALALLAAQDEAGAPNPLDKLALPALLISPQGRAILAEQSRVLQAEISQNGAWERVPDLVGVLLASGQHGAAMQWAWQGAQSAPASAVGAAQVCRVFKAADLGLVRAQAYLNWTRGEGQNPVPGFLAEHPPGELAPLGALSVLPIADSSEWAALMRAGQGITLGLVSVGLVSPQEAEQQGALPLVETVRLLDEMSARGYLPKADRERVRLGLGEVLSRQLNALPPDGRPQLATSIRLAVADFYRSRGDRRAVPLFEAMVAEFEAQEKQTPGSFKKTWIVPLAHLAMFYSEQGDHLRSAQTWARWSALPSDAEWQADWRVAAAREYKAAGQPDRAQALYAAVPQLGDAWQTSLALWDQANALIEKGQHEQARELLQQTVAGEGAGKARVGLQALLALSYYRTGEIESSRAAARASIATFEALGGKRDKGVPEQAQTARDLLVRLDEWERRPIQLDPAALHFADEAILDLLDVGTAPETLVVRTLTVRTLTDVPLQVQSDNPDIKAELFEDAPPEAFATVRMLRVSAPLRLLKQGMRAHIKITAPNEPCAQAELLLTTRDFNAPPQTSP